MGPACNIRLSQTMDHNEVGRERLGEPCPSQEAVRRCPNIGDALVVAYFLHVRARRPID